MSEETSNAQRPTSNVQLSEEELSLIKSVRRQSDAKAAAEQLTGLKFKPRQVRGSCCLFIAGHSKTFYFGATWQEAFFQLVARRKLDQESEAGRALREAVNKTAPSHVVEAAA